MALPERRGSGPRRWLTTWPASSWDPFAEFSQIWDRMSRLFEQTAEGGSRGWMPAAETEETDDAYLVRAELPGMKRDDIQIEGTDHELHIRGEVKDEDSGNTLRRRTGTFSYRASLPGDADIAKATAHLADGILTVRVPKSAQGHARRIEITR